jgi:solute carrier family 25 protein 38
MYFYFLKTFQSGIKILGISPEFSNFLAGVSARAAAGTILMPVTVIKTRFEANINSNSVLATASDILKSQGIRGFFSGLVATTFRDAPYAGIYFSFYTNFKKSMKYHVPIALNTTISAALAATFATLLTHPFDVVKTRMQLDPVLNKSLIKTLTLIVRKDGLVGFLSGIGPRLARKPLQSMITWFVFEELIKFKI